MRSIDIILCLFFDFFLSNSHSIELIPFYSTDFEMNNYRSPIIANNNKKETNITTQYVYI